MSGVHNNGKNVKSSGLGEKASGQWAHAEGFLLSYNYESWQYGKLVKISS
jgi:hypothetical protein